ncbi:MAG: glutamine-hydrolyzing carbamoyl-phosphate synthase small subunit [Candidatus Omnitrophica bacterium]|nr:glutamine-hydrolyzing carbamoyl-phosphate synthase small subunit [Candidatus Omnitrophota bacterium]MBU4458064.1 glutamine-hydrolyzing carbamoyl-phosphate synthase small subunit [Candidatus Omnitrophota bacterium]
MNAKIALEDGRVFTGISFGASGERYGEVVFNTSMTGYQEILTDPSYKGQIVTMTYPLIGNYGVNIEDVESRKVFLEGFVVKECSKIRSNWRSTQTLGEYLKGNNVVGIEGIDTRALTRHIRLQGAMKAVLSTQDLDDKSLVKKAKASRGLIGVDLVKDVTCDKGYCANDMLETRDKRQETPNQSRSLSRARSRGFGTGQARHKIAVLDCGVKYNILRKLTENNCKVIVYPAQTKAEDILKENPDGILLSNGPGDPAAVTYAIKEIKKLLGKKPIFGICLGHQLLGLALGGKTYKLKFGHHGANHPVKDLMTGKIAITSQNHSFCVDIDSLKQDDIEITHMNLNDNTLEGIRHKKLSASSVQFHPEHAPGPHDAAYLFREFLTRLDNAKKN